VFDNLAYKVDGDRVTLLGQVVTPALKSDAGKAVKSIEGVAAVALVGVVANQMDKILAETRAKSVPGTFAVMDELRVENQG